MQSTQKDWILELVLRKGKTGGMSLSRLKSRLDRYLS